jgi:N-carbamoyl-L-amino-acid hydrolase
MWTRLPGESEDTVVIGSHLDCVPDGGWLDGCLGVFAGAAVMADVARRGRPARSLALVDWADEEGARFGHSLLGSSAAAGLLDTEAAADLRDAGGVHLSDALSTYGVSLPEMPAAQAELRGAVAYVELHIEQGPVLEELELPVAAVAGCMGLRRSELVLSGRAAHAGATPMHLRRDPVQAAARLAGALRSAAVEAGGLATVGVLRAEPGIPNAIPGQVRMTIDLRHGELAALDRLDSDTRALAHAAAEEEGCSVERRQLSAIDPARFDADLVARARALAGGADPLTSGPLHDAAAMCRAGIPTVMLFVRTLGGISHSREEDARDEDLVAGIEVFERLVTELLAG